MKTGHNNNRYFAAIFDKHHSLQVPTELRHDITGIAADLVGVVLTRRNVSHAVVEQFTHSTAQNREFTGFDAISKQS